MAMTNCTLVSLDKHCLPVQLEALSAKGRAAHVLQPIECHYAFPLPRLDWRTNWAFAGTPYIASQFGHATAGHFACVFVLLQHTFLVEMGRYHEVWPEHHAPSRND